ncbi:MAG: hypothetical protein JWM87_3934 [Candidatus Eremiobacteraeota bacterium]|nr:hypothetical protein [Candidatus Eremiobacteraeota bacterium]
MKLLKSSAPARLVLVVVIAVVVQFVTHASWFAIALLVTYFAAKEIVSLVLPPGVAPALLAAEPRLRFAALVCDNAGFLAAFAGYFVLAGAPLSDAGTVARFAAFGAAVIVLVAAWGLVGAAALRRTAGAVKL